MGVIVAMQKTAFSADETTTAVLVKRVLLPF